MEAAGLFVPIAIGPIGNLAITLTSPHTHSNKRVQKVNWRKPKRNSPKFALNYLRVALVCP